MRIRKPTSANPQVPFYSAHCPSLGWLYYFRSRSAADTFRECYGGYVLETTPGRIWRVTCQSNQA